MSRAGLVYIIRDKATYKKTKADVVAKLTSCYHDIKILSLEGAARANLCNAIMVIVDVPPVHYEVISKLKELLKEPREAEIPFFFLLGEMVRKEILQAQTLGAVDFLSHPINTEKFLSKLKSIANKSIEKAWQHLNKTQEAALKVSLKVFEDTFANVKDGKTISSEVMRESCDLIIKVTAEDELVSMLSAIRTHHNYTYRHSMMVSGYLTAFGLLIGINGKELQNLTACGLIHDIGKAEIKEKLLSKPGPLTDDEWADMRMHPVHSRRILKNSDFPKEVVDGAIHHHEKIDGTGYPDKLKGEQVSDFARMVAIADIFSGLTEKRSYKASMDGKKAYDIMCSMEGHLDMQLLHAFRPVALKFA